MKNNKKKWLLIIIVIIIVFIAMRNIDMGWRNIKINDLTLSIPRLSIVLNKNEESMSFLTFNSEKHIKKIYEKNFSGSMCNNEKNYYDKKNDITIKEINIKNKFLANLVSISYIDGKNNHAECGKITDPTKIMYYVGRVSIYNVNEMYQRYEYLDKDGKRYKIYYLKEFDLFIKNGFGMYDSYTSLLGNGYLSMQTIFDFMEYQVGRNQGTKEILKDGEATMYRTENLSLIRCNTKEGNKDVYFGDEKLKYKENFCSEKYN